MLLLLVSAWGCEDGSSDPTAVLMAEETRAALEVTGELPSLPELVERYEAHGGAMARGVDRWLESWGASERDGPSRRIEAYALAAPGLAETMSDADLANLLRDVDEAVAAAEALESRRALPEAVAARVRDARRLVDEGFQAREGGSRVRALRMGLQASDRLRSLMPERVALELVERAEAALRRNGGAESYTPQELRRADRLTRGAREALAAGDLARAVRRAYYACQVLGVSVR